MLEGVKKHPVLGTILSLGIISLPQWAAAVWSIFSSEPMAVVVRRSLGDIVMPPFSAYWITVPLGLSMFASILYEVRKSRQVQRRTQVIAVVSQIPDSEKGMLDFGAGIDEAIHEYNSVMRLLTADVNALGRVAVRHRARLEKARSFTDQRRRAMRLAEALDRRSSAMEPRILRLEKSTNLLSESFVGFVELNDERDVLTAMRDNAVMLLETAPDAIANTQNFRAVIVTLKDKRIQQHLSQSLATLDKMIGQIATSVEGVRVTCDEVVGVTSAKLDVPKP